MKNAPYVGKYMLDWEKLKPCDIVLSRETLSLKALLHPQRLWNVLKSRSIRLGSEEYSHAMLYFEGSMVHAHPPIVFASNPQRLCCVNPNDYCFLRHVGLTARQEQAIEDYARERIGAFYSTYEAVKTLRNKSTNTKSLSSVEFCSRLVAQAYEAAGIKLVSNPDYCAPGDFLASTHLKNMGPCTRFATKRDFEVVKSRDLPLLSQKRAYNFLRTYP